MCDFCVQHGDGKKWYLQAKNYSEDLLSDVRRRRFITRFVSTEREVRETPAHLERLSRAPGFVRRAVSALVTRRMKKDHFGQVVPIEEIGEIFGFVDSIVRIPCICRHASLGREVGCCYGVSMGPNGGAFGQLTAELADSYLSGPDTSGFETLTRDEAMEAFAAHEKDGLCHTVWTFMTPFIGGICNCDRSDCMAMQSTVTHDVKVMWRAEYVAEANRDLCTGCRACMRVCQFGALAYSGADKKVFVDQRACYGCGICRTACPQDAIALLPRSESPAVAGLW